MFVPVAKTGKLSHFSCQNHTIVKVVSQTLRLDSPGQSIRRKTCYVYFLLALLTWVVCSTQVQTRVLSQRPGMLGVSVVVPGILLQLEGYSHTFQSLGTRFVHFVHHHNAQLVHYHLYPVVPQHLSIKLQSLILEPKLSTDVSIRPARFLCVTLPWTPSLLLYYTLLLCAWLSQGPTPWILPSVPGFYRICAQSVLPCLCLGGGGHAGPCLPRMVPAALPHLASAACEALTPCLGPSC